MPTIFQDKVQTYKFVTAMLLITSLILLLILLSQYTDKPVVLEMGSKVVLIVVFLMNVLVLVSFQELTISLDEQYLIFGFMKFRKRILRSKIRKIELQHYDFRNYLGYGIRFGRDKTIGYCPRGGKGLKITVEGERREIFFVTNRPEELKSILERGN